MGSRSELMATLALLCATASLSATKEDIVRFQSEVSRGQDFREPIGHNLLFKLRSTGDGWRISVEPSKVVEPTCTDYAWVVNMPIRNSNALDLFPSYGDTAQNIVDKSPFEFNFVLSCADCKREASLLRLLTESLPIGAVPPSEKQSAEAQKKLGTSPQGHGKLWILDSKVSAAPEDVEGKNYGQIDWIRFRVEIHFPDNTSSLLVPGDQ